MTPLIPTPPSAALRIECEKQAFFGFFEALPGLHELTRPVEKNHAGQCLVQPSGNPPGRRVRRIVGDYKAEIFDQAWKPVSTQTIKHDGNGLNLNLTGPSGCFSVVLTRQ